MTESTMELRIERAFNAPVDQVYRAFTDPDLLPEWIAPTGFSVREGSVDVDARVGGHQRVTLVATGGDQTVVDVTFTAVVENELLAGEQSVPADTGNEEYMRSTRVEFQDAGEQTQLVLRQGPFSTESGAEARGHWESAFSKLDALLERP
jgi:uncharacterized protein YndB with AHSA1/START domain